MITISTDNIVKSRLAKIDGYTYRVRRFGSGEYLDISKLSRELAKTGERIKELQASGKQDEEMSAKLLDEFTDIQDKLLAKTSAALTPIDGGDSRAIVNALGLDEFYAMLDQIFNAPDGADDNAE